MTDLGTRELNRYRVASPAWRLYVANFVAVLCLSACGHLTVDYIDFIQHGDIQYVAAFSGNLGRDLTDADLGAEQFRVRNAIARGGSGAGGTPRDGDAAFVSAGGPVYAVRGYRPSFRVAARHDGRLVLYEADSNVAAKIGRDLLDLDGKVAAITLLSPKDGRTVLGRIADPARVRDLVSLVLAAPVDQSVRAIATPEFVGFELTDGTATSRAYFRDPGILQRGIRVSRAFSDAVDELRASAPTPTPIPATVNLARRYDLARASRVTIKVATVFRQNADLVREFAAALDEDRPAFARDPSLVGNLPIVIFEFPDHYVSMSFDTASNTLVVVSPPEEFGVHPSAAFGAALAAASR